MKPGDVVTRVADQEIHSVPELLSTVASLKPGTAAAFDVQRGKDKTSLQIAPGIRPKPRQQAQ
jgi:S1-C subfamily serine protease